MKMTYNSLNDKVAEQRLMSTRFQSIEKAPRIDRFYDEHKKYEGLQYWQGLLYEIDTRLEVINATTELLEL